MEQRPKSNAVGAQIRRLRNAAGLTQEQLVGLCQLAGCDGLTRGTLAKIEAQIRGVTDVELFTLARVLRVTMEELFPKGFTATLKASDPERK